MTRNGKIARLPHPNVKAQRSTFHAESAKSRFQIGIQGRRSSVIHHAEAIRAYPSLSEASKAQKNNGTVLALQLTPRLSLPQLSSVKPNQTKLNQKFPGKALPSPPPRPCRPETFSK